MRVSRLVGLLFLCCLISASLSAQQTTSTSSPPAASDPQAVALVQKSLAVLSGGATVSDVTLTGSGRRIAGSDDETGTATLTATNLGDSKVALSLPSGSRTEIRNHSAVALPGTVPAVADLPAWVAQTAQPVGAWSGPDGALHGISSHNIMTDPAWFFPALTLADIATSTNYVLSYIGTETLNGQSVVHIAASRLLVLPNGSEAANAVNGMSFAALMQHLSQMDIYFDPTTSLPVVLAFNVHPDDNELVDLPVQIQLSNYQSSGGIEVALHVQKFINNSLVLDLQFTNAAFNSGLTAASFQIQ